MSTATGDVEMKTMKSKSKYQKLPVEIDKTSVVRYLKKDVSKTQLYKSLPVYLLILLILSISVSLRRDSDPVGYWVNSKVKQSLVGPDDEFYKITSPTMFFNWYEKRVLEVTDDVVNLGGYIPLTGSMLLRQFRGESNNCGGSGEHSLFPGPRQSAVPTICYARYSDDTANTTSYGPVMSSGERMFESNDRNLTVHTPPLEGEAEGYRDWKNSFPVLVPNGVESTAALTRLLLEKIDAVESEDYAEADLLTKKISHINGGQGSECYDLVTKGECDAAVGCGFTNDLGCVPESVICRGMTNETACGAASATCAWLGTSGCYSDCQSLKNSQEHCDSAGCAYDADQKICTDPRPEAIQVLEGLKTLHWIDSLTRMVAVDQLLYNANSKHFIYVTYYIEILPVGVWLPQVKSVAFHVFALWGPKEKALFALDVLVTLYTAWSLVNACLMLRHNLEVGKVNDKNDEIEEEGTVSMSHNNNNPAAAKKKPGKKKTGGVQNWFGKIVSAVDFAIVFEFFFTALFIAAFTFKWIMWARGIEMSQWNPDDVTDLKAWNDIIEYLNTANTERVLTATAVIFAWLRLFEYVQYNDRLNSLTETIKVATGSLVSLSIIFAVIFLGFMYAGNLVYGIELSEFNTLIRTGGYMMRLLFSAEIDDYTKFRKVEPNWSIVFFGLFFALAWLVLLNMVLAIITSSFNVVKENCKDENGEDTSPSWEVTSVMEDIKKFFKKLTTREQPFAFSAHSVNRKRDVESQEKPGGATAAALDGLKGNYVIDRIRAIQILDSLEGDVNNYFTMQELGMLLHHLHPADVKRIFSKSCKETSFGNRSTRHTDRQASLITTRISDVERTMQQLTLQVADQEGIMKDSHTHLTTVHREIGKGMLSNISETVHNIDENVYNLPPHIGEQFTTLLNHKLAKLQHNVGQPIDGLKDNLDELVALLASPRGGGGHQNKPLSSPLPPASNPIDATFPRERNLVRSPGEAEGVAQSKLTTVEGVVDV